MPITVSKRQEEYLDSIQNGAYQSEDDKALIKRTVNFLQNNKFLSKDKVGKFDYVDSSIFDKYFEQSGMDLNTTRTSALAIRDTIATYAANIQSKYDDLALLSNQLSSLVDWAMLYNAVALFGAKIIVENFDTRDDITPGVNPLYVDVFTQNVTLDYMEIVDVPLNTKNISYNINSNGEFKYGYPIENIIDGDDLSYAEYTQDLSVEKLVLDINVKLDEYKVVNNVSIVTNDFSSQQWIQLKDIRSSLDGVVFTSVYESDLFYQQYLFNNNAEHSFILSSEENNFSNRFTFNFQPTKLKYIQFIFEQNELHPQLDEYKIGIHEITLRSASYKKEGSIIVKKPIEPTTLKALALYTDTISAIDSDILKIGYSFSFDNKLWHDIQPVESNGEIPEIYNFNQDWLSDSINLQNEDSKFIYIKISMLKDIDINRLDNLLSAYMLDKTELFEFPQKVPYKIKLSQKTKSIDFLELYSMPYIGVGKKDLNTITLGNVEPNKYTYEFKLPFNPGNLAIFKIGDDLLERYDDISTYIDFNKFGYYFNEDTFTFHILIPNVEELRSGNLIDPWLVGVSPEEDDDRPTRIGGKRATFIERLLLSRVPITLTMPAEAISTSGNTFSITHSADYKENIEIQKVEYYSNGDIITDTRIDIIPINESKINLTFLPIDNTNITIEGGYRVKYINGISEFIDSTHHAFSVDFENRVLHLRDQYGVTVSVTYESQRTYTFTQEDFEISRDMKQITMKPWLYSAASIYVVKYNVAMLINKDFYVLGGDRQSIEFTSKAIMDSLWGVTEFQNKKIKAMFQYHDNLKDTLNQIYNMLSPILNQVLIIYSEQL